MIEGRRPNVYIAKSVAQSTDNKVEYSKHKGLDSKFCEAMLLNALRDHGELTRPEIDRLLWDVLSDQLTDSQKKSKVGNILSKLRIKGIIENHTKGNVSVWRLVGRR